MDEGIYALNAECEAMQNEIERLEAENAKLVNVLHEVEEDAVFVVRCLQSDIEHVMESETEFFKKWWRAEGRNDNKLKRIEVLEAENAKLRELVRDYEHCSVHADCDRCEYDGKMSTHCPLSPCFPDIDELRKLGIEVDG